MMGTIMAALVHPTIMPMSRPPMKSPKMKYHVRAIRAVVRKYTVRENRKDLPMLLMKVERWTSRPPSKRIIAKTIAPRYGAIFMARDVSNRWRMGPIMRPRVI